MLRKDLAKALDGVEEFSHVFVTFWMHQILDTEKVKVHLGGLGIFATRASIRPNPIGLTLVELVKREKDVLWVRGLDASDGTPVLDIKPYPDWERERFIVVTDFRVPKWFEKINKLICHARGRRNSVALRGLVLLPRGLRLEKEENQGSISLRAYRNAAIYVHIAVDISIGDCYDEQK